MGPMFAKRLIAGLLLATALSAPAALAQAPLRGVALVIGQLTAGLKFQAKVATQREERVGALYAMSRDLSAALMVEEIAEIAARFVLSQFDAPAALLVADPQDQLKRPVSLPVLPAGIDLGIAQWAFDHAESAGHGTDTLSNGHFIIIENDDQFTCHITSVI